jgi:hypothetical protein
MCRGGLTGHRGQVSHDRAHRPAPISRRTLLRWAVDAALLAAIAVSVLLEPVSIAVHSVAGLIFAGFVAPHLWYRRAWIGGVLRRLWRRRSLRRALRWSLSQAALLLGLTLIVTASGLWDWLDGRTRIRWHAISSIILIAAVLRHTWTRRGRLLRRRAAASLAGQPEAGPADVTPGRCGEAGAAR